MPIPDELKEFYFDFDWDNRRVWALEAEALPIHVADLEWQLAYPIWSSRPSEPLFDLRPRDVLEGFVSHSHHEERIQKADMSFALDALVFRGRIVLLDGFHRLARAVMEKRPFVQVRVHPESSIPAIRRIRT